MSTPNVYYFEKALDHDSSTTIDTCLTEIILHVSATIYDGNNYICEDYRTGVVGGSKFRVKFNGRYVYITEVSSDLQGMGISLVVFTKPSY